MVMHGDMALLSKKQCIIMGECMLRKPFFYIQLFILEEKDKSLSAESFNLCGTSMES